MVCKSAWLRSNIAQTTAKVPFWLISLLLHNLLFAKLLKLCPCHYDDCCELFPAVSLNEHWAWTATFLLCWLRFLSTRATNHCTCHFEEFSFFWNKYFVIWSRRIDWNLLIMLIETSFKLWTPATNHCTCHFENTVFNWNRYFVNWSKYLGFTDTGRHFVSDDWVVLQQLPCRLCNKSRQLSHLVDFWLDSSLKEF